MFIYDTSEYHPCEYGGCSNEVAFDDEPYCFEHSPWSGSHVSNYSYKKKHGLDKEKS